MDDKTSDRATQESGRAPARPEPPETVARMRAFLDLSQEASGASAAAEPSTLDGRSRPTLPAPRDIPGYEVLGELGRGGMGVVYKARQRGLRRVVAVKMLLTGGHADEAQLARFRAEAEAVASLRHPRIVQIYETGTCDGCPFFSMEYVDGPSLAQQLARELPPPRRAAALVADLAGAVQYAHGQGVVHRDLKPANVLLTAARPGPAGASGADLPAAKITDFGLAKQSQFDSGLTRTGAVMGTPSYMAPEQAAGDSGAVGPRTDVYALGAILYECLTGRPPFRAPTLADTLDQVRRTEPVPPSRCQAGVPRDLEVICLKCLRKEPAERYATAAELADDLHRYLAGQTIRARPVGVVARTWRWSRRNPAVAGLLVACAALFAAGAAGTLVNAVDARARAREALAAKAEAEAAAGAALSARDDARRSALDALAAGGRAEAAGREATRQLVRVHIASGSNAAEAGDLQTALLWYQQAWAADRTLGASDGPHRTRVAGVLGRLPLLRNCLFHPAPVLGLCWHPSGRWLVTRADDHTVRLWDAADPAAPAVEMAHAGRVSHVALDPRGDVLAAGDEAGCALWDVPSGRPRLPRCAHPAPVLWVAFHPAGSSLATACADGKVRFWSATTGAASGPAIDVGAPASFVAFDPAGRRVLVATEADRAAVYDAATGVAVCPPVPHVRRHPRIRGEQFGSSVEPRFSPDGATFAGAWTGPYVREVVGGKVVSQIDYDEKAVRHIEFSPDGQRVLVHSKSLARWWKPGAEPLARERMVHPRESWLGAISPDGSRVATASTAGKVHLWDPRAGQEVVPPLQHAGEIRAIAFSPDGSCVAAGGTDGTVRVWEPAHALAPSAVPADDHDSFPVAFYSADRTATRRLSRDGRWRLDHRPADRTLTLVRRETGQAVFTTSAPDKMQASGFTPDGRVIYVASEGAVQLWDAERGVCAVDRIPLRGPLVSVAAAPAAGRALVIDSVQFQVYDLATGRCVFGPVAQAANDPAAWGPADTTGYGVSRGDISPDGKRVVVPGGSYRVLRSYDLGSGRSVDVPLHDGLVYRAMFDGSGARVLTCGSDSTARLWEPATGAPLGPALWHPSFVRDAALSADGRTAVTYAEGAVRLWDAETGDLLLPPLPHPARPSFARLYLSADGRRVVSQYSDDKGARVIRWAVPEFAAPFESVPALVGLFTGREVDATRGLSPIRDEDLRRDRDRYQSSFRSFHATRGTLPPLPDSTTHRQVAPPPRSVR